MEWDTSAQQLIKSYKKKLTPTKWPSNGWHHIFLDMSHYVSWSNQAWLPYVGLSENWLYHGIPCYIPKNPVQTSLEYGQWWLTSESYWILKFQRTPIFSRGLVYPTIAAGGSILARGFALRGANGAGSQGGVSRLWIGRADLSERQDWKPWQNRWGVLWK